RVADVWSCRSSLSLLPYTTLFRSRCVQLRLHRFIKQHGFNSVALDRLAAVLGTAPAGIHLALSDHLAIGGLEHEVVLFVAAGLADRKSTRLNSSHVKSSYAVFCLK